ncbi:MAG: DNA-processing protein DprA [Acidimicrobiales bacterium]
MADKTAADKTVAGATAGFPEEAYAVSLAALPSMNPRRLAVALGCCRPSIAWKEIAGRRSETCRRLAKLIGAGSDELLRGWAKLCRASEVERQWDACRRERVGVLLRGQSEYPARLSSDPQAPAVLFCAGPGEPGESGLGFLAAPTVAVVGTRTASPDGRSVARELGEGLAAAGVVVISGLATGIDGAAHAGALDAGGAPPIGVAGNGLDVVYPRGNASLWARVRAAGAVISEAPLGARPEPWRFPVRNRIMAALADVVVVVESHSSGGSLHTAEAANARGVPIMAVPGSVRNPAASGTNALIADGCLIARDLDDVLAALALSGRAVASRSIGGREGHVAEPPRGPAGERPSRGGASPAAPVGEPALHGDHRRVLDALPWSPAVLDSVLDEVDLPAARVVALLSELERQGLAKRGPGWWQRCAGPRGA